ncbi:MAG: HAD family hydrolase [Nanoarchaeota archaeon]|nr:HAD family hydrolase [Nanoarchaeota archaeon]
MAAKKVLILDVDETLLNLEPLFFLKKFKKDYEEYEGTVIFDKYYLSPRPNAKAFLESVKKHFELVAFSVADKELTKQKLEKLGLLDYFSKVYGKESLIKGKKALSKIAEDLNKDIKDVIIIDNEPQLIAEQNNIISISPWFIGSDKEDDELMKVLELLKFNFAEISS